MEWLRDKVETAAFWAFIYYEVRDLAPRPGERRMLLHAGENIDTAEAVKRVKAGILRALARRRWEAA